MTERTDQKQELKLDEIRCIKIDYYPSVIQKILEKKCLKPSILDEEGKQIKCCTYPGIDEQKQLVLAREEEACVPCAEIFKLYIASYEKPSILLVFLDMLHELLSLGE